MKQLLHILYIFSFLWLLTACHGSGEENAGRSYLVSGTMQVDSTVVLDRLVLYSDSHISLHADSIILTPQQTFTFEGHSAGFDELYLCSDGGELCRFYATGGMEVGLTLQSQPEGLKVAFAVSPNDTINPWLQEQIAHFEALKPVERRTEIDSLCHQHSTELRTTLLLRDQIQAISDSVFIRRCLGSLSDEAKPEWLVKSITQLLSETAAEKRINRRLSNAAFQINDSTRFDMSHTRSEYLVIYCWADYDQASVDSLQVLADLLEKEYDMKRQKLLTCCLSIPDSAWWKSKTDNIEGNHTYIPAGLSDPRIYRWRVQRVPSLIICDMYGNVQKRDVWGQPLRDALNRIPNRSGFAHTPKIKPHGR